MELDSESTDLQDGIINPMRKISRKPSKNIETTNADGADPAAETKKGKKQKRNPDK